MLFDPAGIYLQLRPVDQTELGWISHLSPHDFSLEAAPISIRSPTLLSDFAPVSLYASASADGYFKAPGLRAEPY